MQTETSSGSIVISYVISPETRCGVFPVCVNFFFLHYFGEKAYMTLSKHTSRSLFESFKMFHPPKGDAV